MALSIARRHALLDAVRVLVTLAMLLIAAGAVYWAWQQQKAHPWTRDGQVLANVVHIAPQVEGPVIRVLAIDNALVAEDDLLFELNPKLYQQAVAQAEADLASARAQANDAAADARRARVLHERGDLADEDYDLKIAQKHSMTAAVAAAEIALETARLKLSYTKVKAPAAGYITNLMLDVGTYAKAGEAQLALVDKRSFWVAAYFKETDMEQIDIGDPAAVKLMSHPRRPLAGTVESIAFGIARRNIGAGLGDLADVAPTFEWIRLAQRIPVRIRLEQPPSDIPLRIGYTASVTVNPSEPVAHASPE